jgi:hypothetical protein
MHTVVDMGGNRRGGLWKMLEFDNHGAPDMRFPCPERLVKCSLVVLPEQARYMWYDPKPSPTKKNSPVGIPTTHAMIMMTVGDAQSLSCEAQRMIANSTINPRASADTIKETNSK